MDKLKFKIISPEKVVFESEVVAAILPTQMGEVTILPNHIPILSALVPGEIVLKTADGKSESLATSGGFAQVTGNRILILSDTAEMAEEISEERAAEAHKRAEELLKQKAGVRDRDYAALKILMDKELARLKVARKHKKRGIRTSNQ